MENNADFLKRKYPDFHNDPEINKVAKDLKRGLDNLIDPVKTALRPHVNEILQDPATRIQNYLFFLRDKLDVNNPKRQENLERIKHKLHDLYVIKPEDFSEGYFENQRRIARELGHGNIEVTPEMRRELIDVAIADQKSSLTAWVDYLSSPDAMYPDWLKYWALRSVLGLGAYDKEKQQFDRRRRDTAKPFPELNEAALALVLGDMEKKAEKANLQENDETWQRLVQGENFGKMYAFVLNKFNPATLEQLKNTAGRWVKYKKGSDHGPLVASLQTFSTGWCTADEHTAAKHLAAGDFYVFYSEDDRCMPRIPRAAIRMQDNKIAEVRGIAERQNLDPYIGDVVAEKMKDFPDAVAYEQKSADMKQLTALELKTKTGEQLTREDLIFLYEIDSQIKGFGYVKDPRVAEIRNARTDKLQDRCLIFNCLPQNIAHSEKEINSQTKAYVGPLFDGVFQKLVHVDHVYTKFPENRIRKEEILVGGKTKNELVAEMKSAGMNINSSAEQMMNKKDFVTLKRPEQMQFVRLSVGDLFGDSNTHTTNDIFKRAEKLGLDLCPPDTGPAFRLQYKNQPMGEWFRIGMKPIFDADGCPKVFHLELNGSGLGLNRSSIEPNHRWRSDDVFLFRFRKSEA